VVQTNRRCAVGVGAGAVDQGSRVGGSVLEGAAGEFPVENGGPVCQGK